jgi:hypothetical protein
VATGAIPRTEEDDDEDEDEEDEDDDNEDDDDEDEEDDDAEEEEEEEEEEDETGGGGALAAVAFTVVVPLSRSSSLAVALADSSINFKNSVSSRITSRLGAAAPLLDPPFLVFTLALRFMLVSPSPSSPLGCLSSNSCCLAFASLHLRPSCTALPSSSSEPTTKCVVLPLTAEAT